MIFDEDDLPGFAQADRFDFAFSLEGVVRSKQGYLPGREKRRTRCPLKERARNRRRHATPERKAYMRAFRAANREKENARRRAWTKANPEKQRANNERYKAKRKAKTNDTE